VLFYRAALPLSRRTLSYVAYIGAGQARPGTVRGVGASCPPRRRPTLRTPGCARQAAHARLRAPGERANAQLKTWYILRKLRCCPWRAGQIAKAIHIVQTSEIRG
jgi:hypothetical protein